MSNINIQNQEIQNKQQAFASDRHQEHQNIIPPSNEHFQSIVNNSDSITVDLSLDYDGFGDGIDKENGNEYCQQEGSFSTINTSVEIGPSGLQESRFPKREKVNGNVESSESPLPLGQQDQKLMDELMRIGPPVQAQSILLNIYACGNSQKKSTGPLSTPSIESISLMDLPRPILYKLALRLGSPVVGSMRNWEFLAASLGVEMDEILFIRNAKENSALTLLCSETISRHVNLGQILRIIADSNRIDVLLDVRPHIIKFLLIKFQTNEESSPARQKTKYSNISPSTPSCKIGLDFDSLQITSTTTFSTADETIDFGIIPLNASFKTIRTSKMTASPSKHRTILILHHENERNKDLRRLYRTFYRNLKHYATQQKMGSKTGENNIDGFAVLDIDQFFTHAKQTQFQGHSPGTTSPNFGELGVERAGGLFMALQSMFMQVWRILVVLSDDYSAHILTNQQLTTSGISNTAASDSLNLFSAGARQNWDQLADLKRLLHQFMDQEVMQKFGQNNRFQLVVLEGTKRSSVPSSGWASNTLHYRFPRDFSLLCQLLFEHSQ